MLRIGVWQVMRYALRSGLIPRAQCERGAVDYLYIRMTRRVYEKRSDTYTREGYAHGS